MQDGTFGEVGAGLETIAGGGMHTLFVDEKGTVSVLHFFSHLLAQVCTCQVWSCGLNDDAALGRVTEKVPDPENPDSFLDVDELASVPHPLQSLVDENFRAVQVVAGDSICAAVSDKGDLRVWGSFRVSALCGATADNLNSSIVIYRSTKALLDSRVAENINFFPSPFSAFLISPATSKKSPP